MNTMEKKKMLAQMKTIGKVFGLLFDEKNAKICSNCPIGHLGGWVTKEQGCCAACAREQGYFNRGHYEEIMRNISDKYFTKEYGFFDNKKKECKLPRHLRSSTCLNWRCSSLKLTDEEATVRMYCCKKLNDLRLEYYK